MNKQTPAMHRSRLPDRGRRIVDHVGRYHLTTNEVVHALFFRNEQRNAVTKVTARLCRLEYLRRFPFHHPRIYFTLGVRGAAILGLPENRTLPLGPQSLPTEYGVLAFAALGRTCHKRLIRGELVERYPGLKQPFLEQPYCLDQPGDTLELIRVDLGGKPDHVARKCQTDLNARASVEPFAELISRRRFRLVVVTCTAEKATAIRDALGNRLWPDGLLIHLAVVPDLLLLTARLRHAT